MTQSALYDWLLTAGVREPACVQLGTRFVCGRWESIGEELSNGHILRTGRVAVHVLGEGASWDEAYAAAKVRLA